MRRDGILAHSNRNVVFHLALTTRKQMKLGPHSRLLIVVPCLFASHALAQMGASVDHCRAQPGPGVDWHECDLSHEDLSGLDLSNSNLSGAKFTAAKLRGANLSNADLSGSILIGADLQEVDFSGADLRGSFMTKAQLGKNSFEGARLDGAYYNNAQKCAVGSVGMCK